MAFEAFLNDTKGRPLRGRLWGYFASIALHAPGVVFFAVSLLSHEVLLRSGHEAPEHRVPVVMVRIPRWLAEASRGHGLASGGLGRGGEAKVAAGGGGKPDGGGERARRALVQPTQAAPAALAERPVDDAVPLEGRIDIDDADEAATGPVDGFASRLAAFGDGSGDDGIGAGGLGGDRVGGTGEGPASLGGSGNRSGGGDDSPKKAPAAAPIVAVQPQAGAGDGLSVATGGGGQGDTVAVTAEPDVEPGAKPAGPLPVRAAYVSSTTAAYLRTYQEFPKIERLWQAGRESYRMFFEICVTSAGVVDAVVVRQSATPDIDQVMSRAIKSWLYEPRLVGGVARPFCHPMRIEYFLQSRFGS